MKKFLLTLIVTMLTCLGAWAQNPETIDVNSEEVTINLVIPTDNDGYTVKVITSNRYFNAYVSDWSNDVCTVSRDDNFNLIIKPTGPGEKMVGIDSRIFIKVHVEDHSKATSLSLPDGDITAYPGYTQTVEVTPEPIEAYDFTASITGNDGVSCNLVGTTIYISTAADATGTATLTISAPNAESVTRTINISSEAPTGDFTINASQTEASVGSTITLSVEDGEVTWTSLTPSIATVTDDGVVTGNARGEATIMATVGDLSKTIKLTFTKTVNASFNFNMWPIALKMGETLASPFVVQDGLVLGTDYDVVYSSTDENVFTVNPSTGEITPVHAGTAKVQATVTLTEVGKTMYMVDAVAPFQSADITVNAGMLAATVAIDKAIVPQATATEITLTPSITINGNAATLDPAVFDIAYSSTTDGVTFDGNKATIPATITDPTEVEITATVTPKNPADYNTATTTTTIIVNDNYEATKAVVSKEADGTVVITLPSAGTLGNYIPASYNEWNVLIPAKVEATFDKSSVPNPEQVIKNATNIKIVGEVSNYDMQAFTKMVGGTASKLTSLDMGGATLSEPVETNMHLDGTEQYPTKYNAEISWIDPNYYTNNTYQLITLKSFTLPKPCASQTVIPEDFAAIIGKNTSPLENLVIPAGWKEVGKNAFNGIHIKSIRMPNGLTAVRYGAFQGNHLEMIMFPPSIDIIEDLAFNDDPSKCTDVFFTGKEAPTLVHTNAFSAAMQKANNSMYDDPYNAETQPLGIKNGCATRNNYKNTGEVGGTAAQNFTCMMHYPANLTATQLSKYVDITRVYDATPRKQDGTTDAKAAAYAYPWAEGTGSILTPAQFHEKVSSLPSDGQVDAAYYDPIFGSSLTWPSHMMMNIGYDIAKAGYMWNGREMEQDEKDRRGLYQFMIARADAPSFPDVWEFDTKYTSGQWWTICIPLNMTVADVKWVFGPNTKVCKFSKVIRRTEAEGEEGTPDYKPMLLSIEFTNDVMKDKADDAIAIEAHKSYMIKPLGETTDPAVYNTTTGKRVFPADMVEKWQSGAITPTFIELNSGATESTSTYDGPEKETTAEYSYRFTGNHSAYNGNGDPVLMPKYCYFLGWNTNTNKEQFFMQVGTNGKFTAHSAIVIENAPENDYNTFFKAYNETNAAPIVANVFGDEEGATGIDYVQITCGDDVTSDFASGKIYSVNGQYMGGNSSSLKPGLYIVNGKKFIKK